MSDVSTLGPLDHLYRELYSMVRKWSVPDRETPRKAGHSFEDATSQLVYSCARKCGLKPLPPRQKMNLPTRSGNSYQFDSSFYHQETTYLIECKRKQIPTLENVYYFGSKVLDHLLMIKAGGPPVKGIFVSTVDVGNTAVQYSLAFGIRLVDPENPPLEELYASSGISKQVAKAVRRLYDQTEQMNPLSAGPRPNPQTLLRSYEYLKKRVVK